MDGLEGGSVNNSQSIESTLKDEGYQSTLDFTTSKSMEDKLVKMEDSYQQQITTMELEPKLHPDFIKKYKNELTDDDKGFKGQGMGGKRYVRKVSNLEDLKEQYMSKIKSEKKHLSFQQLDDETRLMIRKIGVFMRFRNGNGFFTKLLEIFERKSIELEEKKELEGKYIKVVDELMKQHQTIFEEKDQEIDDLKKKLQAALAGKTRGGCLGESSRINGERKDLKIEELDEECQSMIANNKALSKSDDK